MCNHIKLNSKFRDNIPNVGVLSKLMEIDKELKLRNGIINPNYIAPVYEIEERSINVIANIGGGKLITQPEINYTDLNITLFSTHKIDGITFGIYKIPFVEYDTKTYTYSGMFNKFINEEYSGYYVKDYYFVKATISKGNRTYLIDIYNGNQGIINVSSLTSDKCYSLSTDAYAAILKSIPSILNNTDSEMYMSTIQVDNLSFVNTYLVGMDLTFIYGDIDKMVGNLDLTNISFIDNEFIVNVVPSAGVYNFIFTNLISIIPEIDTTKDIKFGTLSVLDVSPITSDLEYDLISTMETDDTGYIDSINSIFFITKLETSNNLILKNGLIYSSVYRFYLLDLNTGVIIDLVDTLKINYSTTNVADLVSYVVRKLKLVNKIEYVNKNSNNVYPVLKMDDIAFLPDVNTPVINFSIYNNIENMTLDKYTIQDNYINHLFVYYGNRDYTNSEALRNIANMVNSQIVVNPNTPVSVGLPEEEIEELAKSSPMELTDLAGNPIAEFLGHSD